MKQAYNGYRKNLYVTYRQALPGGPVNRTTIQNRADVRAQSILTKDPTRMPIMIPKGSKVWPVHANKRGDLWCEKGIESLRDTHLTLEKADPVPNFVKLGFFSNPEKYFYVQAHKPNSDLMGWIGRWIDIVTEENSK